VLAPTLVSPVIFIHVALMSGQVHPSSFIFTRVRSASSASSMVAGMLRPGVIGVPDALRLRGV